MVLFQSILFYGVLLVILAAAILAGILLAIQSKRSKKLSDNEASGLKSRIEQLDNVIRGKDRDLEEQHRAMEERLKESELLKADLGEMELQLIRIKEQLKQEVFLKNKTELKAGELEKELLMVKKELALTNQMQEGLKGQYDELEEKFSQLFQQFLEEQKKNQFLVKPQMPVQTVEEKQG